MTGLLALAVVALSGLEGGQEAPFSIIEKPEPRSGLVVYQAFVTHQAAGREDAAAWEVLGETLLRGTKDYLAGEVAVLGSQAGFRPKVVTMAGYLRLEFVALAGQEEQVVKVLAQCLTEPRFRDDQVEEAKAKLTAKGWDPFEQALQVYDLEYSKVTADQVKALWKASFRRDSIKLYVGGDVEVGETARVLARFTREWEPLRRVPPGGRAQAPILPPTSLAGTGAYELRGEAMTPSSTFAAARFLATVALGVGKDSTMHRVLRNEKGWGYVSEGLLYPSEKGWVPRFVLLRDGEEGVGLLEEIRKAMIADIAGWDGQTLQRAVVLGRASLREGLPWSPVWLDSGSPMRADVVDRTALLVYLDMVGAGGVSPSLWAGTLENVDLETLKGQATLMLEKASGVYLARE